MIKWTVITVLLAGAAMIVMTGKAIIVERPTARGSYGATDYIIYMQNQEIYEDE